MTTADSNDNWLYIGPDTQGFHIREMNGNGDCIAHVPLERHAARIVANHNAVPRLTDTLRLTRDLLTNQQLCERALCESCQTARQTVIEAINFALTTATTQPDAGEGR